MPGRFAPAVLLRRRFGLGFLAALFGFVALAAWAIASPVGASPDEDYHLVSIWCGAGERAGICEQPGPGRAADARMVPRLLVGEAICYASRPTESAACQGALSGSTLGQTSRGNFAGAYPPVFYAVMSMFVGSDVEASVIAMRLFNAAVFVGLLTLLTWLTPTHRRGVVVVPVLVTVVPLGTFLIASVNPSSWALLSAATLWISLYNYFESSGARRWVFAALATIALVVGAGARADAAAYAGLAIVGVLILTARRSREYWLAASLPAALAVVAAIFYGTAAQSHAATGGLSGATGATTDSITEFIQVVVMVPDLWVGMFGKWGLGWLDTAMPALVWVAAFSVFVAVICIGLSRTGVRKYIAVGLAFAAFWGVPALLQVQTHAPIGAYVQPRYVLPLAILLVAFALAGAGKRSESFTVAQLAVLVIALIGANSLALQVNIRRYVTGSDVMGVNLDSQAEWWWNAGPTPMVTWVVGSLAFALCVATLAVLWHHSASVARDSMDSR